MDGSKDYQDPQAGDETYTGTSTEDTTAIDDSGNTTDTTPTETGDGAVAPSSIGNGQAIADSAMQFQDDAYVSADSAPGGFDCSEFACYVVLNMVEIDIGGIPEGQVGFGSPVEYGAWAPGDLVFFANTIRNTIREGVLHISIAIGGSEMIHAENESTGVTISSITSDYYTSHNYSSIRL